MGKKIGIWMDKRTAKVVSIENSEAQLMTIDSNVEEYHPKGGSGARMKGGPQDVVHESKYLAREKRQFKAFFKNLIERLADVDALVVFGPAETGRKFADELAKSHHALYERLKGVEKADSMTDNQVKAWVRTYFG
jgi:hypothetical protein